MRSCLVVAICLLFTDAACGAIYSIGNSLTHDAIVNLLDGYAGRHIRGNGSLPHIYANPSDYTFAEPSTWDVAFAGTQYDVLTFQPYGGSVEDNVTAISQWMNLQPNASVVLHVSWPELNNFSFEAADRIAAADAMVSQLQAAFPGRSVSRDRTIEALLTVQSDIAAGTAPFASLGDLYRDEIHMTTDTGAHAADHGEGRYLMHNVLREALGQAPRRLSFPIPDTTKDYLHGVVARTYAAVPEASSIAMLAVACVCGYGYRRWCK